MKLEELQELLSQPKELIAKIEELTPKFEGADKWEPEKHDVMDEGTRPKRKVDVDTGVLDTAGNPIYRTEYREVNRIPSSTNKLIVDWAVRGALGEPVEYRANPLSNDEKLLFDMFNRTIKGNKMEYLDQEIERKKEVYQSVAEVWYPEVAPEGYWDDISSLSKLRLRCVVLSPEDGDTLTPIYDSFKDLLALSRQFEVKEGEKTIKKMELFMADKTITYMEDGGWIVESDVPNPWGKLNVVYDSQARRETQDVEPKLARREVIDSDNADENKASGRPILVANAEILKVDNRADTGQTFQVADGGDLRYVESKGAQVNIESERKNLLKDIFYESSTPDPELFDKAGVTESGIAIKLKFTPYINKAKSKQQGALGMARQRRANLIKHAIYTQINISLKDAANLDITPVFKVYLPENETENFGNIIKLVEAGLLSKLKAIEKIKLVDKPEEELQQINKELDEASARALSAAPKVVTE